MAEQNIRQIAYKVWIADLLRNKYEARQGEWEPNYIDVNGKKISRVNIIANVVEKQDTERLSSAVIDDGSGNISARCFNENTKILRNIVVGDTILVVGKPRMNNNEMFIVVEIARKLENSLWLQARKKELEKEGKTLPEAENIEETDSKRGKIMKLVRNFDKGDGALQEEVIEKSGLSIDDSKKVIKELLEEGAIYQPKINRLKTIE
ncbi:hypothetical protein J4414_00345 [Candidatus Woesearchaeota archaeon]|nr:hypothetical protein [Candidatus Woesearchaeota archaeon]